MKKYHAKGTCSQCLFEPRYNGRNWCSYHERDIEDPNKGRCNQFYRGDFARR